MQSFFNEILYRPLFNALVFLYENASLRDFGLAIILLTVIIRFVLFPLFHKAAKHQAILQKIQPEIKKIQEEYKDDKEKQALLVFEVWKKNDVNPFASIILLLAQLPVLIALYWVFLAGFSDDSFKNLYAFIPRPEHFNSYFLGLINLKNPSILLAVMAALAQLVQGYVSLPKIKKGEELSSTEKMMRQMVFIAPGIAVVVMVSLPAAVALYWLTSSIFSVFQQLLINKHLKDMSSKSE